MFTTHRAPMRLAAAGAVTAAVLSLTATAAEAALACPDWPDPAPWRGSVTNLSDVGIGVIHLADGQCTKGLYDVILPPGKNTRTHFTWGQVAGVYIGDGFRFVKDGDGIVYGRGATIVETTQWDGDYTIDAYRG